MLLGLLSHAVPSMSGISQVSRLMLPPFKLCLGITPPGKSLAASPTTGLPALSTALMDAGWMNSEQCLEEVRLWKSGALGWGGWKEKEPTPKTVSDTWTDRIGLLGPLSHPPIPSPKGSLRLPVAPFTFPCGPQGGAVSTASPGLCQVGLDSAAQSLGAWPSIWLRNTEHSQGHACLFSL